MKFVFLLLISLLKKKKKIQGPNQKTKFMQNLGTKRIVYPIIYLGKLVLFAQTSMKYYGIARVHCSTNDIE
jgi:hypothetical protein